MPKRPGNASFPGRFHAPFIGGQKVPLKMQNSENAELAHNRFTRPYPKVEDYQDELKPFAEAGCEVRFSRPQHSHVSQLRGTHRALEIYFEIEIPDEARENADAMREFLLIIWKEVKQTLEEKKASFGQR